MECLTADDMSHRALLFQCSKAEVRHSQGCLTGSRATRPRNESSACRFTLNALANGGAITTFGLSKWSEGFNTENTNTVFQSIFYL